MSDIGNPELPEPEKAPAGEDIPKQEDKAWKEAPSMNGNAAYQAPIPPQVDMEKLVDWMKHTDKQIVILTLGQLGLAAAVMFLLWKAKGNVVKVP